MKTPFDPRHLERQRITQALFEWQFRKNKITFNKTKEIINNLEKIDKIILLAAPEWPIEKISKIDLSILRLAVFELLIDKKEPIKVIIDEAVELAKEFGGETSSRFINGALGKVVKILKEISNELIL